MTLEEYKEHGRQDEEWAPGWEAIDKVFEALYPGQEPVHYGTSLVARANLGGEEYLDGYSIYTSPNGYKHLVTYGMTELYWNEEAFGGEWSSWGYEMTIKLKEETTEECLWAINMLANLARYTYKTERFFEPNQFIAGNGTTLHIGTESAITALFIVEDTEARGIDTVHGKVDFIQLVGITTQELEALKEDRNKAKLLIERMKKDNPYLVTDMARTLSYL